MTASPLLLVLGGVSAGVLVFLAVFLPLTLPSSQRPLDPRELAIKVLKSVPLIDGHNDLPYNLRLLVQNQLSKVDLRQNLTLDPVWGPSCPFCYTDIPRLRAGLLGAQFWVAYVSCNTQYKDAVEQTIEQIDVILRMIDQYSDEMRLVTTAKGIEDAFNAGKIGSLIAVEGGHSIDSRLAVLRLYYEMGARYLTLTHSCTDPWADASNVDAPGYKPIHNGLTEFGKTVVREMNRLGMMVDLSHVSKQTQIDAIATSRAPVIFSHSCAYTVCKNSRNVRDQVLLMLKENNGIIMLNFFNAFVACDDEVSLKDLAIQLNYIRQTIGVDHVGIGSDFDGIFMTPTGMEDVSKYPDLFAHLAADTEQPWTEEELRKLAGLNFLRVFKDVERVRDEMAAEGVPPYEDLIPLEDLGTNTQCITF